MAKRRAATNGEVGDEGGGSGDGNGPDAMREDVRAARRRASMRKVQEVALDAFEARGFERVSIDEIARGAGVGTATVYRHFGTKERIVLWDDYDAELMGRLAARLATSDSVAAAMLGALSEALAELYARDAERILRRTRLTKATPALTQASAADLQAMRGALARVLREARRAKDELEARVAAGTLVAVLEAAIDHWLEQDGRTPLERCLRMAFARLERVFV